MHRPHRTPWVSVSAAEARISDGISFSSKAERLRFEELKSLERAGEVWIIHRHPIFDLGGGVVYKPDFLVVYADGRLGYEEVKGRSTHPDVMRRFKRNARLVAGRYGVEVELVQR